jgi:hypothetical protein
MPLRLSNAGKTLEEICESSELAGTEVTALDQKLDFTPEVDEKNLHTEEARRLLDKSESSA